MTHDRAQLTRSDSNLTLTLSSPLVDSTSSSDSPGAWMVTDLSPRMLLSRLFERCLSLLSLERKKKRRSQRWFIIMDHVVARPIYNPPVADMII